MANYKLILPHIDKWEGGLANDADDSGGFTNKGVTISTWKLHGYDNDHDGDIDERDLALISRPQWESIVKKFWDGIKGDQIKSQPIAELIMDWFWGSGKWAVWNLQALLNNKFGFQLKVDGIFGYNTLSAVNQVNDKRLLPALNQARLDYYNRLAASRPKDKKFLKGWINRAMELFNEKKNS